MPAPDENPTTMALVPTHSAAVVFYGDDEIATRDEAKQWILARYNEREITMHGRFAGALMLSREFDLVPAPGQLIHGNVDSSVSFATVAEWNRQFTGRLVIARVRERSGFVPSPLGVEYELLSLTIGDASLAPELTGSRGLSLPEAPAGAHA